MSNEAHSMVSAHSTEIRDTAMSKMNPQISAGTSVQIVKGTYKGAHGKVERCTSKMVWLRLEDRGELPHVCVAKTSIIIPSVSGGIPSLSSENSSSPQRPNISPENKNMNVSEVSQSPLLQTSGQYQGIPVGTYGHGAIAKDTPVMGHTKVANESAVRIGKTSVENVAASTTNSAAISTDCKGLIIDHEMESELRPRKLLFRKRDSLDRQELAFKEFCLRRNKTKRRCWISFISVAVIAVFAHHLATIEWTTIDIIALSRTTLYNAARDAFAIAQDHSLQFRRASKSSMCSLALPLHSSDTFLSSSIVDQPQAMQIISEALDAWEVDDPHALILLLVGSSSVNKRRVAQQVTKLVFAHCTAANRDTSVRHQMDDSILTTTTTTTAAATRLDGLFFLNGDDFANASSKDTLYRQIVDPVRKQETAGAVVVIDGVERMDPLIFAQLCRDLMNPSKSALAYTMEGSEELIETSYNNVIFIFTTNIGKAIISTVNASESQMDLDMAIRYEVGEHLLGGGPHETLKLFHAVAPFHHIEK